MFDVPSIRKDVSQALGLSNDASYPTPPKDIILKCALDLEYRFLSLVGDVCTAIMYHNKSNNSDKNRCLISC